MADEEIKLTEISIESAADMLSKISGRKITVERIRHHVEARKAPTNEDGTINLFTYCAWMVKELHA